MSALQRAGRCVGLGGFLAPKCVCDALKTQKHWPLAIATNENDKNYRKQTENYKKRGPDAWGGGETQRILTEIKRLHSAPSPLLLQQFRPQTAGPLVPQCWCKKSPNPMPKNLSGIPPPFAFCLKLLQGLGFGFYTSAQSSQTPELALQVRLPWNGWFKKKKHINYFA